MRGFLVRPFVAVAGATITIRARRPAARLRREDAALTERAAMLADLRAENSEDLSEDRAELLDLLEHDLLTL